MTMSPKNSASFFSSTFTSFLPFCQGINCKWIQQPYVKGLQGYSRKKSNKLYLLTSATKKRVTTFDDLISLCCIQDFLTAILSAKWLPAERIPINISTGPSGTAGAFHLLDISRSLWGAKLGCDMGNDAANIESTSISPFKDSPVASSSAKPYQIKRNILENYWWKWLWRLQNVTHSPIRKRSDMSPINIHMIPLQACSESEDK